MFSSILPTKTLESEQKTPVAPKILTKAELREAIRTLTYVVPGAFTSVPVSLPRQQRKGRKGKKSKGGELLRFPSPQAASQLNKPYHIFQEVTFSTVTSSTSIPINGAINFTFNQLDQVSQLAAVFDQYRLAMVQVRFLPLANIAGSGVNPPRLYTAVDLDDSTAISTTQLQDYPGVQTTEGFKPHTHTFVPSVAVAMYSGAFTSFGNESAPWIDTSSPSVLHYGVKYAFSVASNAYSYDVYARYHFMFRNVR